jgi:hypothetical protein
MRGKLASLILIALLLSAPLAGVRHPVIAQGEEIPIPTAAFGEHPRLLITQAYVDDVLKPRQAQNTPAWTVFETYVKSADPESDAEWTPGTALRSLVLAWMITGDTSYARRGRDLMIALVNDIESDPVMSGSGGLSGAWMEDVAALAVGYDWLFNALSADDQTALQSVLWRAANRMIDPTADTDGIIWLDGQLMAFGNYEPRWLWAITAVGLALWGTYPEAPTLIDYARSVFTDTTIPALDLQEGGSWAEGPVYGFIGNWPRVQTALAWWTAAGENYFDDTRWWYDRLAYDMFLYYPSETRTYNQDWGQPIHNYPSIIGDSERYHPAQAYGRAQDLLLSAVFANTGYSDWMDWFLRQPPDSIPRWMAVEEFLWRDPDRLGTAPLVNTWYAPYLGHVFMRSNWTDADGNLDPDATYVSFNAGDRLSYHQFYDQGSFTIFHQQADLVARSGVYSGDGTSDEDVNYYVRTVAGNSILICDLAENFDGIRPNNDRDLWLNDCGQRTMSPNSRTAINMDYLIENWQTYDTGSITRFGESGDVTYIRADITGAYNSTVYTTPENRAKVSSVVRELVYWRPGIVIVHDHVVTTYPAYTPMLVFHFQTEPTPNGLFFGSLVGDAAVYMQNLKPNSRVSMVPGYQVGGQTVEESWGELATNDFENTLYAPYRLEIVPAEPDLDNWFLTTFIAQDAADPAPTEGLLVAGDTMRGVVRGTVQVMFDLTPGDEIDVTDATFQIGPTVEYILVTGLMPGAAYRIETVGSATQTLNATEAGMLVISGLPAGAVHVVAE